MKFGSDKPFRRRRSTFALVCATSVLATLFLQAKFVSADISEDAERLVTDWSGRGAQVKRLTPIFAEHGQSRVINIAPSLSLDTKPGCITVAFIGAQTIDFAAAPLREGVPLELLPLPDGHPAVSLDTDSVRSTQGVATISRCNDERAMLEHLVVSMHSPRGAVDAVVASSSGPLGDARDVLAERVVGVVAPRGNPGRPIEPGPLAERVTRAEERARFEGAQAVARVSGTSSTDGMGQTRLRLSEGCHRISVMATVPTTFPRAATDVDAEARDDEGRMLARDRAETPDARLDFCLGETARITILYGGASGAVPIMMLDAVWPIPAYVPNHWGARVRAGFAQAFQHRNTPAPVAAPFVEALGSSGATMIPAGIEAGRCYFAAAAVLRGEPRNIRISAILGDRHIRDDAIERPEGVGLSFCSDAEESVRFDVDARGNNVFWVFALFPLAGGNP